MNQPNDDHSPDLEERVKDLEQLFGKIIKNEEDLIKLSKRQTFNVREISGSVGNLQLDVGDLRERFDTVERKLDKIDTAQGEHTKRFDRIETIMLQILDRLPQPEGE